MPSSSTRQHRVDIGSHSIASAECHQNVSRKEQDFHRSHYFSRQPKAGSDHSTRQSFTPSRLPYEDTAEQPVATSSNSTIRQFRPSQLLPYEDTRSNSGASSHRLTSQLSRSGQTTRYPEELEDDPSERLQELSVARPSHRSSYSNSTHPSVHLRSEPRTGITHRIAPIVREIEPRSAATASRSKYRPQTPPQLHTRQISNLRRSESYFDQPENDTIGPNDSISCISQRHLPQSTHRANMAEVIPMPRFDDSDSDDTIGPDDSVSRVSSSRSQASLQARTVEIALRSNSRPQIETYYAREIVTYSDGTGYTSTTTNSRVRRF